MVCKLFCDNMWKHGSSPNRQGLPENEIETLIRRSEAEAIIFDKEYLEVAKKSQQDNSTNLKLLICMDDIQEKEVKTFKEIVEEGIKQILAGDKKYDHMRM